MREQHCEEETSKTQRWKDHYERIFKGLSGNSLEGSRKASVLSHGEAERELEQSENAVLFLNLTLVSPWSTDLTCLSLICLKTKLSPCTLLSSALKIFDSSNQYSSSGDLILTGPSMKTHESL